MALRMKPGTPRQDGFTLTELAVVIAIIGLLLGGMIMTLSAQNDARQGNETQRTLEQAREAVIGFAVGRGRLPCPASASSLGTEDPATGGACASPSGFLPAATLGLQPTDGQGFLLDAWGNRVRYAVTMWDYSGTPSKLDVFTTTNGMREVGITPDGTGTARLNPDLVVCTTAFGSSTTDCGSGVPKFQTPAVIFSLGKTGSAGPSGPDDNENVDGDRVFVARSAGATGSGDYDDIVIWISPNILFNRLVSAGPL